MSFFFGRMTQTQTESQKALRSQWDISTYYFWPHVLDLWPTTLNYELDLDIHTLDSHAKIKVCMFVRSADRVRRTHTQTHRQTHRQCQNYYTHHVRDMGCNDRKSKRSSGLWCNVGWDIHLSVCPSIISIISIISRVLFNNPLYPVKDPRWTFLICICYVGL